MPVIRMRCSECHIKWFYDEFHQKQPDIDMTTCGNCGGDLIVLDDDPAPEPA
jgi:hypothetical protein